MDGRTLDGRAKDLCDRLGGVTSPDGKIVAALAVRVIERGVMLERALDWVPRSSPLAATIADELARFPWPRRED